MSVLQENYDEAKANYHGSAACLETAILDLLAEVLRTASLPPFFFTPSVAATMTVD